MEVVCEHCNKKLNIPDEKIPKGKLTVLACPKCKNKITLDTRSPEQEMPAPKTGEPAKPAPPKSAAPTDADEEDEIGFYEEDTRLAFVLESDPQDMELIKKAVEGVGYKFLKAENSRKAVGKLRLHHFDLLILSDRFDGIELVQSPIVQYMNHLSMSVRRRIFFALIGDEFKTMDNMMAYSMSANLVINRKDMENLESILKRSLSDNERFYKVYMDMLVEVGKA